MSLRISLGRESPRERVALLHGFAGSPLDWTDTAAEMDGAFGYALPGHHAELPAPRTFDEAVDSLLERLPRHPVHLVGYSLGGRLALGMVAAAPERFLSLGLVAAHTGLQDEMARSTRRQRDAEHAALLAENPSLFFQRWDKQRLFLPTASPQAAEWRARRASLDPQTLAATMTALSPGRMPSYLSMVGSLTLPLFLFVGARDDRYRDHYAAVSGIRPDVAVHVIPGAAHRVLLDAPRPLGTVLSACMDGCTASCS